MADNSCCCPVIGFIIAGTGASLFYNGVKHYYLKKTIEYTPTSKAIAVAPGTAEVSGKAQLGTGELLTAPFSKKKCVFYFTELYKWSGSGKHRRRNLVKQWKSGAPISLEDETGRILVQPALSAPGSNAMCLVKKDRKEGEVVDKRGFFDRVMNKPAQAKPDDPVYIFLADFYPSLSRYEDRIDIEETYIEPGDLLYVLGTAKVFDPKETEPRLIIAPEQGRDFCIADGTEKDALSGVSWGFLMELIAGPPIFLAGYLAMISVLQFFPNEILAAILIVLGLIIFIGMYISFALVLMFAFYNGLIILKNNIGRARANIDVLLKKRHDLIPELVETVKAYAKHEKEVNELVAELRSDSALSGSKALLAILEAYPKLKANDNFLELQEQLSKMEGEIAGSRGYYNDSVMLYNRQISVFPHAILARLLGMKPMEYNAL